MTRGAHSVPIRARQARARQNPSPAGLPESAPSWIRTSGLSLRRGSLYPAELSGRGADYLCSLQLGFRRLTSGRGSGACLRDWGCGVQLRRFRLVVAAGPVRNPNHIRRHSAAVVAAAVLTFALLALAPALSHAALDPPDPLRRRDRPRARLLAGLPPLPAPRHVRAARPPRRLPRHPLAQPELSGQRDRAPAGDRGRTQAAAARASAIPLPPTHLRSAPAGPFTGLGFDACSTPSTKTMAAWTSSPYRAIGVYIGGENRACSQPNLTPCWVASQTAAGWHLIPTYVGPQAPTSSCSSCAKLSASRATAQGVAAADRRRRPGQRRGDGPRQPDLLRHGVLQPHLGRDQRAPSPSSRPGPNSCTRSATSPASTAAAPPGSPTSPTPPAAATPTRTTSGSPTGTGPADTPRLGRPRQRLGQRTSGSTSTRAATTRPTAAPRSTSTTTTSTAPTVGTATAAGRRRPGRRDLELTGTPARGAGAGQGLGL